MIHTSPLPDLDIPKVNILDYLFPESETPSDEPVWHDSANPQDNVSPRQMLLWIKRLIIGLDRLGLKKGDVCLIHAPNNVLVPAAYLGIVGGGRSFSAINPIYTVDEIVHQMKLTEPKCILAHPSVIERDIEAAKKAGTNSQLFLFTNEEAPLKAIDGVKDWREMIGSVQEAETFRWRKFSPEESVNTVATINFSSGTTGLPKGVMISHHSLIANVEQTAAILWPRVDYKNGAKVKDERWLGFLPLYHAFGQLYANMMACKFKVPIYIMRQFVYEDYLRAIQDYKVTNLQLAPPILIMMAKRPETAKYDLSSVRSMLCGGAQLSKDLSNEISKKLDCGIRQGWGMTELTCGSIMSPEPSTDGSVGRLLPNNQMKLVDEQDNEVGFDSPGEMLIKSPNVMLGYWRNEAATRESLSNDGWLRTGDISVINKEGYIWIVDRKKELIKVRGLQVAPAELEGKLLECEMVVDVAVVGITLQDQEYPRAYVVLSEEAKKAKVAPKQIQDWLTPRVAKYKALAGGVKFVDEIPKLQSGKIQRNVLKEWSKRDAPEIEKSFDRAKL